MGQEALISERNEDFNRETTLGRKVLISKRSEDFIREATLGREALISERSEDFSRGTNGSPEAGVGDIILEQGFPFLECTSIKFRVRGALSCGAG